MHILALIRCATATLQPWTSTLQTRLEIMWHVQECCNAKKPFVPLRNFHRAVLTDVSDKTKLV
jgi:hypothetical protein